jgi:hypothetical protein
VQVPDLALEVAGVAVDRRVVVPLVIAVVDDVHVGGLIATSSPTGSASVAATV